MNKIKLNNVEFEVESYNKNTHFNNTISSTGSCSLITADLTTLNELAQNTITSIQIYSDGTLIYNAQNLNAKIESINEYLAGNRINIGISFIFSAENEVPNT